MLDAPMLETLTQGFTAARDRLGGVRELSDANIDEALRDVRMSLLEADVDFAVVKTFLARVRERVPGITLTIVGTWDRHARRYRDRLFDLARQLGSWIEFRQNVSRDEMRAVMATHRYGLRGMREEHFGMAPAELARAGCIVWVPRGGGQMEIVDREPALMYDSEDDAVDKIVRTLNTPSEQERLRAVLRGSERFSTAQFMARVRAIVNDF